MTPAQQAALTWAIEQAEAKATAAFWGTKKSPTKYGADLQRARYDQFQAHADALKALREAAHG